MVAIETPLSWPCCLYSNHERHITTLTPTIINLNIGLLIKRKCCLCFQPPTCTHFGRLNSHVFLYVFLVNFLAMLRMSWSFKNNSFNSSPFLSIISFTRGLCLFMTYIWKIPIEGAPTQRHEYHLIHELKMLTSTHFWSIHEQQVPPCLHARMLHNISLQLLGVCKIASMWKSDNLSYSNCRSPFH
jgi:hypothetical protein